MERVWSLRPERPESIPAHDLLRKVNLSELHFPCNVGNSTCLRVLGLHAGILKSATVGVFTPQELTNATNRGFLPRDQTLASTALGKQESAKWNRKERTRKEKFR